MKSLWSNKKVSIRFTVVSIFVFATFITATIAISLQYHFSKQMAYENTLNLFSYNAKYTGDYLSVIDGKSRKTLDFLSKYSPFISSQDFSWQKVNPNSVNLHLNEVFSEIMLNNKFFYAMYLGFPNGNYYEVINLEANAEIRNQVQASHTDRWVVVKIEQDDSSSQNSIRSFYYLNESLQVRATRSENTDYDARKRPWFINAEENKIHKTAPYLFQNIQASGQTYSTKIGNTDIVIALDIALTSISEYLQKQKALKITNLSSETYIYNGVGEVVASDLPTTKAAEIPVSLPLPLSSLQQKLVRDLGHIKVSNESNWAPVDFTVAGQPRGYSIDIINLIAEITGLQFEYINGFTWAALKNKFIQGDLQVLHSVLSTPENQSLGLFSKPILSLPFYVVTKGDVATITHIEQLSHKSLAIPKGWSIIPVIKQNFPLINIQIVDSTRMVLEQVAQGKAFAGIDNGAILTYIAKQNFIDNMTYHKNIDLSPAKVNNDLHIVLPYGQNELLTLINLGLEHITAEQKQAIADKWLNVSKRKRNANTQKIVPYKSMISLAKNVNNHKTLLLKEIDGEPFYLYISSISDSAEQYFAILAPVSKVLESSIAKVRTSIFITALCLLFIVPISWFFAKPIVTPILSLQRENKKIMNREFDAVKGIDTHIIELDDLSTSLVNMSGSIKQYQYDQKELMDSILRLIAQAIDDKSAYTAQHCNRVPELGIMLADAAALSNSAEFKHFSFKNDDEYREFKIAAWLHDCGKLTTPEHIVDKGTKLETIYNRVHEIRMRFEVLRRDAEIEFHKKLAQNPADFEELSASLAKQYKALTDDYHFVAHSNVGGEFMSDEDISRLQQIATRTWVRNFDNQIGLSPIEEKQHHGISDTLPVIEQLISDKPEHIVIRTKDKVYDPKFGIKIDIPENEVNSGELYNLCITRGTLTEEDRFKINEHIIGTIKMLDNLPFPPELANVPRYASTHHETLKGTGYPRKLCAEDLTTAERILVIADIFEALTAADRPYKKAKSLSQSIDILHNMALDHHIDTDLFKLFLSSGIYLTYANKYLNPEQIDEVDLAKYM